MEPMCNRRFNRTISFRANIANIAASGNKCKTGRFTNTEESKEYFLCSYDFSFDSKIFEASTAHVLQPNVTRWKKEKKSVCLPSRGGKMCRYRKYICAIFSLVVLVFWLYTPKLTKTLY